MKFNRLIILLNLICFNSFSMNVESSNEEESKINNSIKFNKPILSGYTYIGQLILVKKDDVVLNGGKVISYTNEVILCDNLENKVNYLTKNMNKNYLVGIKWENESGILSRKIYNYTKNDTFIEYSQNIVKDNDKYKLNVSYNLNLINSLTNFKSNNDKVYEFSFEKINGNFYDLKINNEFNIIINSVNYKGLINGISDNVDELDYNKEKNSYLIIKIKKF